MEIVFSLLRKFRQSRICQSFQVSVLLICSPLSATVQASGVHNPGSIDQLPQLPSGEVHITAGSERTRLFLQSQFSMASESDFLAALALYYERPRQLTHVFALSAGLSVADTFFGWPAEIVAYGGIQYFGERGYQSDISGVTFYLKAYKEFSIGHRRLPLRLGIGEGLSYASRIPIVEVEDFAPDESAKLTNYLEWTMQTSLVHLLGHGDRRFSPGIRDVYIGYSIFHRSTVFGLFASEGGGVNFMGIGVELVLD